jgi:cell division protease FtsH
MIDREIREIIDEQYKRAKDILLARKEALIKGAKLLLEKEKLEGDEIRAILQNSPSL